jgi:predicted RNA-binding protein with TRAM domain
MPVPDPHCLFSARIEERSGDYVVQIPTSELDLGTLDVGSVYRVGLYPAHEAGGGDRSEGRTAERGRPASAARDRPAAADADRSGDGPPVEEGEVLELEVEDVGDQGDGLARVGPGYVVFVPEARVGDRPRVRITTVRENFAFAERVE